MKKGVIDTKVQLQYEQRRLYLYGNNNKHCDGDYEKREHYRS